MITYANHLELQFKEVMPGIFQFQKKHRGFVIFSAELPQDEVEEVFGVRVRRDVFNYLGTIEHFQQLCTDYGWLLDKSAEELDDPENRTSWLMTKNGVSHMDDPDGFFLSRAPSGEVSWQHYKAKDSDEPDAKGDNIASLWAFLNPIVRG